MELTQASTVRMPHEIAARVVDPKSYGEWKQIHRDFAWLRREMPLSIVEAEGYDSFWLVTKHDDIQEIGRQPAIFRNNGYRKGLVTQDFCRQAEQMLAEGKQPVNRSLLTMDAPEHMRYRLITQARVSPKEVRVLQDAMRTLAKEAIDNMEGREECDFLEAAAHRYPLRVILSMLGIPRSDEEMMLDMTQRFFNPHDEDVAGDSGGGKVGSTANHNVLAEMFDYFAALVESRRANPTDDVASLIANAKIAGEPIAVPDAVSYYMTIATAGHDTTSSTTAGAAWALAKRPDQFAKVKADRSLIPSFIEEAVRWVSPVHHFMRTATRDYEIRGQQVREGDWLMLSYPSGNRDEDIFDEPFEFRVDRTPGQHIGFGYGAHVCLGQHLARLEMTCFYEEFFNRIESIELAGEPRRYDSILVGGTKRLPIRYKMSG